MNKEEIEERISYAKSNFTDGIEIFLEIIEEQQKELEQKESILDKVTDKLKKDANKKIPLAEDMDWVRCRKEHAQEILNIIEGGIKND